MAAKDIVSPIYLDIRAILIRDWRQAEELQKPLHVKGSEKTEGDRKGASRSKDLRAKLRMDKFKWKADNFNLVDMAEDGLWEGQRILQKVCKICICVLYLKEDT